MSRCILVVDDEAYIRRILALQLTRAGFTVTAAVDGKEALELVDQRRPDLIITDLQMPNLDGLELCQHLYGDELTREIPVLLLTARGFELDEIDLKGKGNVVGVLSKPFGPGDLLRSVAAAIP